MAKQLGPYFITGCIQNLQFYKMEGKHYVRKKSSLTSKRVKKSKSFTLTMVYAGILGKASKIASAVYKQLPATEKEHRFYRVLTGMAMQLLKKGIAAEEVYIQLYNEVIPAAEPAVTATEQPVSPIDFAEKVLNSIFSVALQEQRVERCIVLDSQPP